MYNWLLTLLAPFLGSSFEVENEQYQYLYKIFAKPRIISLKMKLFFIWTFNLRMEPEIFQKGNFSKRLKPQTIPERWKGAIFSIQASSYLMLAKKKKKLAEIIIALEIC